MRQELLYNEGTLQALPPAKPTYYMPSFLAKYLQYTDATEHDKNGREIPDLERWYESQ